MMARVLCVTLLVGAVRLVTWLHAVLGVRGTAPIWPSAARGVTTCRRHRMGWLNLANLALATIAISRLAPRGDTISTGHRRARRPAVTG
jgi:hypothetical protein